ARDPERRSALPRRVITIGAAARALPDRFGPGGDRVELALQALSGPGILRSAPGVGEDVEQEGGEPPPIRDEAPGFLALLVDPTALPDVRSYKQFLALAASRELVHRDLLRVPAPCATELVDVTVEGPVEGAVDVAVALVTNVCVTGVTLADLAADTSFMNPANWSDYAYWCDMVPDPANPADPGAPARFLEVVALDCARSWFTVAVWLDVSPLVRRPNALIRTYTMSADQRTVASGVEANGAVDVDEGTIKVVAEGGHLRVTTTKRVHFTTPIDPHALAVIACGAGYGALAAEFVVEGTGGRAEDVGCAPPAAGKHTETVDEAVRRRVEAVGRSVDECATAAKVSFGKAAEGTYTADDLVGDLTGSVARSVRAWWQLADLAAAVVQRPVSDREVRSDPVPIQPPAAKPSDVALVAPMASAHGHVLQEGRVRFEPPPLLPAGSDAFTLVVQASRLRGTTYLGVAQVTEVATGQVRKIDVDVQIP
ncbi:MAG: hypothetical protein ACRD08_08735, partial [Acidimicrobiales bacterium]